MSLKKLLVYSTVLGTGYSIYKLNQNDKEYIRRVSFNKGRNVSQKFKEYQAWHQYIEPLVISKFSTFFTATHCFIEGLVSDNKHMDEIKKDLQVMHKDIIEEIIREHGGEN